MLLEHNGVRNGPQTVTETGSDSAVKQEVRWGGGQHMTSIENTDITEQQKSSVGRSTLNLSLIKEEILQQYTICVKVLNSTCYLSKSS